MELGRANPVGAVREALGGPTWNHKSYPIAKKQRNPQASHMLQSMTPA